MAREYKLTRIRLLELEKEYHYLKTTRLQEVAEDIKTARAFGDLSENSEYDDALNEQGMVNGRIEEIQDILAHAVIIDGTEEENSDTVTLGCTVKVLDLDLNETELYAIVGSQEADPMNQRISDDSPFGKAMIGRKVGDVVEVDAPIGVIRYQILSAEK